MGSYDIIVKTEEIRRRVQEGDFDSAQRIMDTMAMKKVKNIADLSLFADVYIHNKKYNEAIELLYKVYKKSKTRRTLYQLVEASIGRKNIDEAERYLSEYKELAPNDFSNYIFRYKLDKARKEPYIILIDSLKKLKSHTYMEKWAYELAKLYYKAGMEKECIQECSDIILWFGEGSYVEKAKILKAYYSGEVDKDEIIQNLKNRATSVVDTNDSEDKLKVDQAMVDHNDDVEDYYDDKSGSNDKKSNNEDIADDNAIGNISLQDQPVDQVLDELAESVAKEVDILMTSNQDSSADSWTDKEEEAEADYIVKSEEKNEEMERLDKLSKNLNVDIQQIFDNFLHVKSIQKQLVKSLELIMKKHTKSVQMIITGPPSSGKTTLAKGIAIFLNRTGKLKTSKMAKISAIKLNEIDITNMKEDLRNSCLVIENASELKKQTIEKLLELIRYFNGDIAVVFEENKKNMNRLFRECPKLMELFNNRIHLPVYTDEELLGFAYSYIRLQDYKIHPLALEVLRDGVNEIITNTKKEKRLESISKYVQSAMTSADLRTGKLLTKLVAEGRLSDLDVLSLLPEYFTYEITI